MNYKILSNEKMLDSAELYDMRVLAPEIAGKAQAGQIAHLFCGAGTTLRRPLSICDFDKDNGIIRFCYEVRGAGTKYLSELKKDEYADIIAPYGHGFDTSVTDGTVLLVGGGIGIYPLLSLSRIYGNRATALLGFRSANLINLTSDFTAYGTECKIITDDGSTGRAGFVTELLRDEIGGKKIGLICVCGPKPMMRAVAEIASDASIRCQVSMEEHMACGVGACLGCVCRTMFAGNGTHTETYKRVCVDGPVFESGEIIW